MSGVVSFVACVAAVISAYHDGSAVFRHIKKGWQERRNPSPQAPLATDLEHSLQRSCEDILRQWNGYVGRFDRRFEVGDEIAVATLKEIIIELQTTLLTQLRDNGAQLDIFAVLNASDLSRTRTISVMHELYQRLSCEEYIHRQMASPVLQVVAPGLPTVDPASDLARFMDAISALSSEDSKSEPQSRRTSAYSQSGSSSSRALTESATSLSSEIPTNSKLSVDSTSAHEKRTSGTLTYGSFSSAFSNWLRDVRPSSVESSERDDHSEIAALSHSRYPSPTFPAENSARPSTVHQIPQMSTDLETPIDHDLLSETPWLSAIEEREQPEPEDAEQIARRKQKGIIAPRPLQDPHPASSVMPGPMSVSMNSSENSNVTGKSNQSNDGTSHPHNPGNVLWPPKRDNNYSGFCKGAWKQNSGLNGFKVHSIPVGYYSLVSKWKCVHCLFDMPMGSSSRGRDSRFDPKVFTHANTGIRYRLSFLAKSHVASKIQGPPQFSTFGCMFCCYNNTAVLAFRDLNSFMNHVGSTHGDFTANLLGSTRCIFGRIAGADEDFDINVPRKYLHGYSDVSKQLTREVDKYPRDVPAASAYQYDNVKSVKTFLDSGADVNQQLVDGEYGSVLATAASSKSNNIKTVKYLLKAGADVNRQLTHGKYGSALAAAASKDDNLKTVKLLLKSGAVVNQQLTHGEYGSALAAAVSKIDNAKTVKLLLDFGADINQRLTHGNYDNAFVTAIHKQIKETVRLLQKAGAATGPLSTILIEDMAGAYPGQGLGHVGRENFDPRLERQLLGLQTVHSNWELPSAFEVSDDLEGLLFSMATLTRRKDTVELASCGDFLERAYGTLGRSLLNGIIKALRSPRSFHVDGHMLVETTISTVSVCAPESAVDLRNMLRWICLTFRKPIPLLVSFSAFEFNTDASSQDVNPQLPVLLPLHTSNEDNECWRSLFDSAVVVLEPSLQKTQPSRGLELDFNVMLQLAAVEYPVLVESGLVLIGYTTALIPIELTQDDMILWHIEVSTRDSQIKVSDSSTIHQKWLQSEDLGFLQSKKALLGWCSEATVLLGTDRLTSKVAWSDARVQHTTWHWRGANLQLVAQSAAHIQIGGKTGLSFERSVNTLRFDPSQNYLRLLRSSMIEQIVLYDVSAGRAWLVPLLSVLHHMILVYCSQINERPSNSFAPLADPTSDGASASFEVLRDKGGVILEGSGEDKLTIRELVMGFSANLSRVSLQPPRRSTIYGYEFMDIVMNLPKSELKKSRAEGNGSAWISLLSEINCLLCSDLGDVIIGKRSFSAMSPCNRLPQGLDLMAASMHSIERLSIKHGSNAQGMTRILTNTHSLLLTGNPFQQCQHDSKNNCCWSHPLFLQEIQSRQYSDRLPPRAQTLCLKGALVFGAEKRTRRFTELLIRGRETYQPRVETISVTGMGSTHTLSPK